MISWANDAPEPAQFTFNSSAIVAARSAHCPRYEGFLKFEKEINRPYNIKGSKTPKDPTHEKLLIRLEFREGQNLKYSSALLIEIIKKRTGLSIAN